MVDRNPWWKEEFSAEYKEKEIYANIKKFIHLPQIIAFTGLRRVGKTTLMYKIAEDYIKKGLDSKNIIYFPFDEFNHTSIQDVIRIYEELMDLSRGTTSIYLGYLEKSFLLRKLYNHSKNRRKVERKLKRYYPTIPSIDLLFREGNHSKSKIFEWLIVSQLGAEFFWRDPRKNEVDVVIPDSTPIEVKWEDCNWGITRIHGKIQG